MTMTDLNPPPLPSPPKRKDNDGGDDRPLIAKLLFPVPPPPSPGSTAPLSSPMQCQHDNDRETKSRRLVNVSDITRLRHRRHIQKIYQMATDVVDGYGDEYCNKHNRPLPQETVDKIMLLYHHRIECRCVKVGLTVEEEEQ